MCALNCKACFRLRMCIINWSFTCYLEIFACTSLLKTKSEISFQSHWNSVRSSTYQEWIVSEHAEVKDYEEWIGLGGTTVAVWAVIINTLSPQHPKSAGDLLCDSVRTGSSGRIYYGKRQRSAWPGVGKRQRSAWPFVVFKECSSS